MLSAVAATSQSLSPPQPGYTLLLTVGSVLSAVAATSQSLSPPQPGYTGEWTNADGTVYLRARSYNPALGRFLQRDTFAGFSQAPQSLNRYAYAEGNPSIYSDPTGHEIGNPWRASVTAMRYGGIPGVISGTSCFINPACWLSTGYLDNNPAHPGESEDQRLYRSMCNLRHYTMGLVQAGLSSSAMEAPSASYGRYTPGSVSVVPDDIVLPSMRSAAPPPELAPSGGTNESGFGGSLDGPILHPNWPSEALALPTHFRIWEMTHQYDLAKDLSRPPVAIGRNEDIRAFTDRASYQFLNSDIWQLQINDAWITGAIDRGQPVRLLSNPSAASTYVNMTAMPPRAQVVGLEIRQMEQAGWTVQQTNLNEWHIMPPSP